jgi:hypothetical protein
MLHAHYLMIKLNPKKTAIIMNKLPIDNFQAKFG